MSAQIRGAHLSLLLVVILATMLVAGCGREPEEEPAIEINADEVPVIGNTAGDEPAEQPDEQPEEAADDAADAAPTDGPDQPAPEALDDQQPDADEGGLSSAVGGGLQAIGIVLAKLLFVLILPAAIAGTLLGMPGGVLVLADAIAFSAFHGWATPPWWVLVILLLIAVLAETAENVLSFAGVKHSGASNTTGVWTMVGGLTGAVFGGILAPLLASIGALAGPVGWIILSIVPPIGFGMLGGFLGGYYFERHRGRSVEEAKKAGWGALIGRFAGSFTKAMLVAVMAAVVLISTWGALF